MIKITKSEEIIAKNTAWLVGKCLSFIDITIEGESENDRYSKKNVLKRLFEENIYNTRNSLFEKEGKDISKACKTEFMNLKSNLNDLIETAYAFNESLKAKMISLVDNWINEIIDKIKRELECII